ncbi:MAG: alpha/beta hydrolase [Butyrivibrio sp.]|nr:alpha/beta hydrolase [Butyrivibrio sp.]
MRKFKFWPDKDVIATKRYIESDGHKIPILILKKKGHTGNAPGVLWIHGGGYATGMKEMVYMGRAERLVQKFGAVVISVGYRLSAFHPFPDGFDDCYKALLYLKEHVYELGINDDQIMVGGESAGGGLCAAICMKARDTGDVNIAYQMPLYPMIDNLDTDSSRDNHAKVWNTRRNHAAWKMYLRNTDKISPPPYAAPARQTDYSNLPPAYTFVGTAEPFYNETLTFVDNLKNAGVEASVDVYENMYHAFDMMEPDSEIAQKAIQNFEDKFEYAMHKYFAAQKK